MIRDEVKLWTRKSRSKFYESITDKEKIDKHLCKIEDELKLFVHDFLEGSKKDDAPKELLEEEKAEAMKLLCDPSLLFKAGQAIAKNVEGERENTLLLYLALTSRHLARPINIVFKAESASGKNYVVENTLKLFPSNAYLNMSGMSAQALVYLQESFSHRFLIIAEMLNHRGKEAADYNLRTLLSEGRLIFYVVTSDPKTKQFVTQKVEREGPTGLVTTTTSPSLHPENETRYFSLALNESDEQTKLVKKRQARSFIERPQQKNDWKIWKDAQNLLEPVRIQIPFAESLADLLPDKPIRIRRDFPRLLAIIEASALLHQFQRQSFVQDSTRVVTATLADYYFARAVAGKTFVESLHSIHPRLRLVVETVGDLSVSDMSVSTLQIAQKTGLSKQSLSRWLNRAVTNGYLECPDNEVEGKQKHYKPGLELPEEGVSVLPSVEELAELVPRTGQEIAFFDPLTGEETRLVWDDEAKKNLCMGVR